MKPFKLRARRERPEGKWVQITALFAVAGIAFRKENGLNFFKAIRKAHTSGLTYGVNLEWQPNNKADPYAIAVFGISDVKTLFGMRSKPWHIGYVPAETAKQVHHEYVANDIAVAAELYDAYLGKDEYLEIRIILLCPNGERRGELI